MADMLICGLAYSQCLNFVFIMAMISVGTTLAVTEIERLKPRTSTDWLARGCVYQCITDGHFVHLKPLQHYFWEILSFNGATELHTELLGSEIG